MVPINEIAFFRGKLKHQNEVLVFLGSNYFVERTVDECKPIIDRRIQLLKNEKSQLEENIDHTLKKSELADETGITSSSQRFDETESRWNDDGTFEIRETVEDEKEEMSKVNSYEDDEAERIREEEYQRKIQLQPGFLERK